MYRRVFVFIWQLKRGNGCPIRHALRRVFLFCTEMTSLRPHEGLQHFIDCPGRSTSRYSFVLVCLTSYVHSCVHLGTVYTSDCADFTASAMRSDVSSDDSDEDSLLDAPINVAYR